MRQGYFPQRQNNARYQTPAYAGPFRQPQYAPQYMQQPAFQQAPGQFRFKKSGAKYTIIKEGKAAGMNLPAIHAWRMTKFGMQVAKAFPFNADVIHKGEHHEFVTYMVEISNANMGTSQKYPCVMRLDTRKIFIEELGLVISPNGSGQTQTGKTVTGYFGRKKNR